MREVTGNNILNDAASLIADLDQFQAHIDMGRKLFKDDPVMMRELDGSQADLNETRRIVAVVKAAIAAES